MVVIGLDLSYNNVGISIFKDNKPIKFATINANKQENEHLHCVRFAEDVFNFINSHINIESEITIEDVFLGKDFVMCKKALRLQGALDMLIYKKTSRMPKYMMACTARKLAGLNSRSHKAEIQLAIGEKYKILKDSAILKEFKDAMFKLRDDYNNKKIENNKLNNEASKLSRKLDKLGCTQHVADAIVLCEARIAQLNTEE